MAKKDIARSAVETSRRNKWQRRFSNKVARVREKAFTKKLTEDPELFDEDVVPQREVVQPEFGENLSPGMRWLQSKCGQKWDDVYSELCTRFDTRNISAYHIVEQHMKWSVGMYPELNYKNNSFYVDEEGYLRLGRGIKWRWGDTAPYKGPNGTFIKNYVGKRKVMEKDDSLFWMTPGEEKYVKCKCWYWNGCRFPDRRIAQTGHSVENQHKTIANWKIQREFTDKEKEMWADTKATIKNKHLIKDENHHLTEEKWLLWYRKK